MFAKYGIGGLLLSVLLLTAAPALAAGRSGGSGGHTGGGGGGHMGGGSGSHAALGGGGTFSGGGVHSGGQIHGGTAQSLLGRGGNGNQGTWNRGGDWGHGGFGRNNVDNWGHFGVWSPSGWGRGGYWGPYTYRYYGWPGYNNNYYLYDTNPYYYRNDAYSYQQPQPYAAAYAPAETGVGDLYGQSVDAFRRGDYRTAMRFAGHAAVESPRDVNIHLLMSLCLFALGDYRGAAMEARGLAAMGYIPDWATVYRFYGHAQPYTDQLRALENFAHDYPTALEGRFLLGFQYLTTGYKDAAKHEFLTALKVTPQDQLAGELLTKAGGTIPEDIGKQQLQHPLQQSTLVPEEARKNVVVPEEGTRRLPLPPVKQPPPAPSVRSEPGTPSGEHLF